MRNFALVLAGLIIVDAMTATIVRRIMFGGLAAWVFIYAWEQYHLGGHTGTAIGLGLGGLVLVALAITSKGGG
jgi:hypothetical protein